MSEKCDGPSGGASRTLFRSRSPGSREATETIPVDDRPEYAFLVIVSGPASDCEIILEKEWTVIGRSSQVDIPIDGMFCRRTNNRVTTQTS